MHEQQREGGRGDLRYPMLTSPCSLIARAVLVV